MESIPHPMQGHEDDEDIMVSSSEPDELFHTDTNNSEPANTQTPAHTINPNTLFSLPHQDILTITISILKTFSHNDLLPIARQTLSHFIELQSQQIFQQEEQQKAMELIEVAKKNRARQLAQSDEYWNLRYQQLKKFKMKHGHCDVPSNSKEHHLLSGFIRKTRTKNAKNLLCPYKKEALDELGFTWNVANEIWEQRYQELISYHNEMGDCEVPNNYEPNPQLGKWVCSQRQKYQTYQKKHPERIKALDKLGFTWSMVSEEIAGVGFNERWDKTYQKLVEYKLQHGTLHVPKKHPSKLAPWCKLQKKAYHEMRISGERRKKLEEIGFDWGTGEHNLPKELKGLDKNQMWEFRFKQLLEYKEEHGDCEVPQHFSQNKSLGQWVKTQRKQYALKKLPDDRQKRLDNIGFQWVLLSRKEKGRAAS